jgi:hypothetical protein
MVLVFVHRTYNTALSDIENYTLLHNDAVAAAPSGPVRVVSVSRQPGNPFFGGTFEKVA